MKISDKKYKIGDLVEFAYAYSHDSNRFGIIMGLDRVAWGCDYSVFSFCDNLTYSVDEYELKILHEV